MSGYGQGKSKRRSGCLKWAFVALVLLGIALFATYRWAVSSQSVATLDRIDAALGGDAAIAHGEFAFGEDPAQRLYVFTPADMREGETRPVVIFVHGGGWQTGDPADYAFAGRRLAEMGYVAVVPGYRLKEAGAYPAMLEDGAAAVRWAVDNVARFGGDPRRIYAMGHSAGAYNVVMLALDRQWLGREGLADDTLKGVVGLAGPYDFLPFDGPGVKIAFGGEENPEITQPVNFARGDAPPLLLLHGLDDTVVEPRNSRALADAVGQAGGRVELQSFSGMDHVQILTSLARPFSARDVRVLDSLTAFLPDPRGAPATPSVPVQGEVR